MCEVAQAQTMDVRAQKALIFAAALVWRAAVGLHPYSGEDTPPMYGDYEAQRHWMEIALHVPVVDWYRNTPANNLSYWGLDYPPLSAYHSWVAGKFVQFVEPNATALHTSHGFQSERSRAAMRATVLAADCLVLFPVLAILPVSAAAVLAFMPALVLVDHGHFQYNGVSLAMCMLAIVLYRRGRDTAAAVVYCFAVYYKHLCLYFALAFLAHHVARVGRLRVRRAVAYVVRVGSAIVGTTVLVFAPWIAFRTLMVGVLLRLFPVARGLYEDKVANFWCSISIIVKMQRLMTRERLVALCAVVTALASAPFCVAVVARRAKLTLACAGCALAAFLFSFQVHEKQILIPTVALAMEFNQYPRLCTWMILAASASLFPLLRREGLVLAYVAVNMAFMCVAIVMWPEVNKGDGLRRRLGALVRLAEPFVLGGGLALHVVLMMVKPPVWAPDILVLLLTGYSCAIFLGVYATICAEMWWDATGKMD